MQQFLAGQRLANRASYSISIPPINGTFYDYNDPKLNEILNRMIMLFKVYKAFIEFDKSDKNQDDIDKQKF